LGDIAIALTGINILRPPLTTTVTPESIVCSFKTRSLIVTSATSSLFRIVFVDEIKTSSSISLFGRILKTVKFLEEFLIENLISYVLQIEISLKLHSLGLHMTKHYGIIDTHFKSIFLPFFTFNFKLYSTLPPPSTPPRKLWTMQIFYFPFPSIFPFEGETLKRDSF